MAASIKDFGAQVPQFREDVQDPALAIRLTYISEFVADTGTTTAFARRTRSLAQNLAAMGIDVTLVTDEPGRTALPLQGVPLTRLVTSRLSATYKTSIGLRLIATLGFFVALSRFLQKHEADVLLLSFHEPLHALLATLVAKVRATPAVIDAQDSWLVLDRDHAGRFRNALRKLLEKLAMQSAAAVSTVTPTLNRIISAGYRVDPRKVHVVYNGADIPAEVESESKDIDVIHLGSPREHYATLSVIEALGASRNQSPRINIVFLGCIDEPYATKVKSRAEELELMSKLSFLPPVPADEVDRWLERAKVALHTFNPDPIYKCAIGVKVFEYLAHGLPIVHLGPKDGETARLIMEGPCGIVVESPEEVPTAIASLLRDHSLRSALSQHARKVASRHTWRQAAIAMASIVRDVAR